jgi:hypothetical protein
MANCEHLAAGTFAKDRWGGSSPAPCPYYAQLKLTLLRWILTQSGSQGGPENGPNTTQNLCFLGFSSTYWLESGARGRNHTFQNII